MCERERGILIEKNSDAITNCEEQNGGSGVFGQETDEE